MTALADSPTIQFHRRDVLVTNVTAYTVTDAGDAVLIHIAEGNPQGTGNYRFVSYCQTHEVAWDPEDFGACPLCDNQRTI